MDSSGGTENFPQRFPAGSDWRAELLQKREHLPAPAWVLSPCLAQGWAGRERKHRGEIPTLSLCPLKELCPMPVERLTLAPVETRKAPQRVDLRSQRCCPRRGHLMKATSWDSHQEMHSCATRCCRADFFLAQTPCHLLMPQFPLNIFLLNIFLPLVIQPVYVGGYPSYCKDVQLPSVQSAQLNQSFLGIFRFANNN